ncbi:MAG: calcium/sodium antiporter [Planctomycetota bacterium]|jgi:cation:H+ antiporter
MDALDLLGFLGGLILLVLGAEWMVRGSSRVAVAFGLSPLVVGLTIVALGTSSPEIAVSVSAAIGGQGDLAVGNVLGSNIFNTLAILGVCALIVPITVAPQLIRFDVPVMAGASLVMLLLALDGGIDWLDGGLLVVGLIAYNAYVVRHARRESRAVRLEYARTFGKPPPPGKDTGTRALLLLLGLVVAGLALLTLGSRLLVDGASAIAEALGISRHVIGLTIVSAGTGLPELATSFVATRRGERDIAMGNVVGSNLYNILGVLGLAGIFAPDGLAIEGSALRVDMPVVLATALVCIPAVLRRGRLSRRTGIVFLLGYAAYLAWLVWGVTGH